jgi:protein tyrosine/serine phosphatase
MIWTKTRRVVVLIILPLTLVPSPSTFAAQPVGTATAPARPASWAAPVGVEGAPNLHRVAANVYRSAQPEEAGFKALALDPGIKTVVSLRAFHNDTSMLQGTGIQLLRVPIFTWNIDTEDVVRALAAVRQAEAKGPVLLHCQHGADRTGLIMALYRVLYQGWTKAAALDEMQNGHFGYHAVWGNIPRYLRRVDIERLRTMVSAAKPLQPN